MQEKSFSFWRQIIWPIHRNEVKKVVSMLLLMALLCVCYSVLRNLKDTVILTAANSGAEVIPFIKVWGMLPGAILGTWFYTKLRSKFSRENVFYILVGGFVAYFLAFAFFIYPNSETLNFTGLAERLSRQLPEGFSGLIAMVCNWTFTMFYIISELWSVLVLTVLFWGFANDVTPLSQAKRCYGLFNIGSNMAPILGGFLAILFVQNSLSSPEAMTADLWQKSLIKLSLLISVFASAAMGVFYWINRKVVPHDEHATDSHSESVKKSGKTRLSLRDCIRYISKSRYLLSLALIVLGFNIAINFTDVLWKAQLKKHFVNPQDLMNHMNQVTIGIGCIATVGGILFSIMVRRLGWTFVAILTPAIMVLMAIGFFSFLFFESALTGFALTLFGTTPLIMTVYFGSMQNCLSKAGKYSVFDASKELAFLALDSESRLRGKAAIDGLGSGVGKSGASLTYQALILGLGSVSLSTPYIAGILVAVFAAWIYSVRFISKEFKTRSDAAEGVSSEVMQTNASTTS
ncbi:MAG: Npt1/Npt2 family nucleotide transporter [Simkaniaceae bacterium]|nr:Npt1/Npt2 family nucleotide transporter [Candidatus Sacchlamyda saccharinae]